MKSNIVKILIAVMFIVTCLFTMTACDGGLLDLIKDKGGNTDQTQTDNDNDNNGGNDNNNNDDGNTVDLLSLSVSFSEDSWEIINAVSQSGQAQDYYSIGDEKEILVAAEPYTFRIIGFNHDNLSDGTGKAGITLDMTQSMNEIYMYNNSGLSAGSWKECDMRNTHFPYLFNLFESEVKAVVKAVNKLTVKGGGSSEIETTADKLFLLSTLEVRSSGGVSGEGTRYAFFAAGGTTIKKRNGLAQHWFLRSPVVSNSYLYGIYDSGSLASNITANQSNVYLSFAFCV